MDIADETLLRFICSLGDFVMAVVVGDGGKEVLHPASCLKPCPSDIVEEATKVLSFEVGACGPQICSITAC